MKISPKGGILTWPVAFAILDVLSKEHSIFITENFSDSEKSHILLLDEFGEGRASLFFSK